MKPLNQLRDEMAETICTSNSAQLTEGGFKRGFDTATNLVFERIVSHIRRSSKRGDDMAGIIAHDLEANKERIIGE